MTNKERAPFRSGVDDYEAISKRIKEIGAEFGIDLNKKPETPAEPGHYNAYQYP